MKKLNVRSYAAAVSIAFALSLASSSVMANTLPSGPYPGGTDPNAPAASVGTDRGNREQPERLIPGSVLGPGHRAEEGEKEASSALSGMVEEFVLLIYGARIVY